MPKHSRRMMGFFESNNSVNNHSNLHNPTLAQLKNILQERTQAQQVNSLLHNLPYSSAVVSSEGNIYDISCEDSVTGELAITMLKNKYNMIARENCPGIATTVYNNSECYNYNAKNTHGITLLLDTCNNATTAPLFLISRFNNFCSGPDETLSYVAITTVGVAMLLMGIVFCSYKRMTSNNEVPNDDANEGHLFYALRGEPNNEERHARVAEPVLAANNGEEEENQIEGNPGERVVNNGEGIQYQALGGEGEHEVYPLGVDVNDGRDEGEENHVDYAEALSDDDRESENESPNLSNRLEGEEPEPGSARVFRL